MRTRFLITGAAGFVGKQLVKRLIAQGHEVWAVDKIFHDFESDLVKFTQADVREMFLIDPEMFETAHTAIHLANLARIDPSWEKAIDYYDVNILGTLDFYRRCQRDGIPKFMYVSSSSVYGNNKFNLQHETYPLSPTNPYAISKQCAEQSLLAFANDTTDLLVVRPFTMYGSTMATEHNALAIGKFVHAYKNKRPLTVHGTGDQRRDFIHVDEAIDAMLLLLDKGKRNNIYNIGTGKAVSINEIVEVFKSSVITAPARPGPDYDTCADIDKLRALGFDPKITLLEWLRGQLKQSFKEFEC